MSGIASPEALNAIVISFIANVGVNDEKAEEIAAELAQRITLKSIKLLGVVLALKEELTSEDEDTRRKALHCLSSVLSKVPEDILPKSEVSVIIAFYQTKVTEKILMKDVLDGFCSLVKMKHCSSAEVTTVLTFLKNEYQPTKYLTPVRYYAFKVLENIYEKCKRSFSDDENFSELYIMTFIHIANGEKDPRNLLMSFNLNEKISSSFDNVEKFREDLFDILFCYFPITFKPPKNDPYKITNEDLKLALRSAIYATPVFAEDAFSNLTDKLTASSPIVKNDTLLTLKGCVDKFGGESCLKQWLPIWNALKFEIMHNNEGGEVGMAISPTSDIYQPTQINNYQLALDIITSLARSLVEFDEHAFNKFFLHIFEELKPNFTYDKNLKQSCNVLASIASANPITFDKVITVTLPLFLEDTSEIPKMKLLIMNLSFFFDAYINVFSAFLTEDNTVVLTPQNNRLHDFKDSILMILSRALTGSSKVEVTLRTLSVIQFSKLVKMPGYMTNEEISLVVQYLSETILTDNNKNMYYACLEGLKSISDLHEDIVFDISLRKLLSLLPDDHSKKITLLGYDEEVEKETILKVILDYTTSRHSLVKESIFGISSKLYTVAKNEGSSVYCFLLASTLYALFENNIELIQEDDADLIKRTIQADLFATMMKNDSIEKDDHNLTLLSNVLFFINLKSSRTTHQPELLRYNELFNDEYKIFESPSRAIIPYVKIICALDKSCEFKDVNEIFRKTIFLLKNNQASISEFEKLGYLELLMTLSNKWIDDGEIIRNSDYENKSLINLETLTWINKGSIMKNSNLAKKYLDSFIELLTDDTVGSFMANLSEVFVIDISSFQKYKGIIWNNNVKLLYKQKFFSDIFHTLIGSYKETSEMYAKSNYLTALSLILKHTPNALVKPFMKELLPCLLQALEIQNAEVKVSALETLKDTADKNAQLITEHFHSLVPMLLQLVKIEKSNNVRVRILSLELLEKLTTTVPLNYCESFKNEILNSLVSTLDDKKRVVRKQCVNTRQAYFELGHVPGE